jgi:hypothetical protein
MRRGNQGVLEDTIITPQGTSKRRAHSSLKPISYKKSYRDMEWIN